MNRVGGLTAVIAVVLGLAACQSNVHRAKVLDVRLGVEVTHLRLLRPEAQPQKTRHPLTLLDIGLTISNPSDQRVWANDCHGQAFDDSGDPVYTFSFTPAIPAGAEMEGHGTWTGSSVASARVPHVVAALGVRATATCQAWDWGDYPPI